MKNLLEQIEIIADAQRHPLKQHEDDRFARKLFRAEVIINSRGLFDEPKEILDLLVERCHVEMTDCDSLTHGAEGSRRASEKVNQQIAEINSKLSGLADTHGLSTETRESLGIPLKTN